MTAIPPWTSRASRPRVLVARVDNVGDVLLAGPAVRALAAHTGPVTFVASPGGAAAAALLPGVETVIEFAAPFCGFTPPPVDNCAIDTFVKAVAAARIDKAFVFTSSHQSPLPMALLLRLAGVPWIAATSRDYPGSLLDVRERAAPNQHEVERALALVEAAGYRLPNDDDGSLALRPELPTWRPFTQRYVVVHPGASVPARAYDAARMTETVGHLLADGWAVAVTGGNAERALTARVSGGDNGHGAICDLGGVTDLGQLAGVIAGASAVVCGNTGPAHIAAAVGTPVVSIFAPVVPASRWRPWRVPHVVLGAQDIECAGCRARTCPQGDHACLAGVTPTDVRDAVRVLTRAGDRAGRTLEARP